MTSSGEPNTQHIQQWLLATIFPLLGAGPFHSGVVFADERSLTLPLLGPAIILIRLMCCWAVSVCRGNAVHATRTHIDIAAHLCAYKRCGGRTAVRLVHSASARARACV